MRRATIASLCLSLIVSGFGVPAASAAPPSYTIVDLGAPTGYSIAYGLKTDRSWRGCREFVLTLSDGSQHTAWFRFRR